MLIKILMCWIISLLIPNFALADKCDSHKYQRESTSKQNIIEICVNRDMITKSYVYAVRIDGNAVAIMEDDSVLMIKEKSENDAITIECKPLTVKEKHDVPIFIPYECSISIKKNKATSFQALLLNKIIQKNVNEYKMLMAKAFETADSKTLNLLEIAHTSYGLSLFIPERWELVKKQLDIVK
ncbi:MAG: hypothetical protein WC539_08745 [Nitrospirota bacterium]